MIENKFLDAIFSKANLSLEEKSRVVNSFTKVLFKKNDFLFREDQILNHYYYMEKGFARSFTYDFEGNEVSTKFYSESHIVIDWTSFMLRTPTQENFQANTDCVCWRLSFTDFQVLFNSIEGFRESGRARFAKSYLELKQNRLAIISNTAKERYLLLLKEHPEIINQAPLKHIASYLGVTDTSLSRIRKEILA